jgi:diguanylate cyclase (GGDEF)-like protein
MTLGLALAGLLGLGVLFAATTQPELSSFRVTAFVGAALAIPALALAAAALLRRWVARPVARLAVIAARVEAGENVAFPDAGPEEVSRLAETLERMRLAIWEARTRAEVQQQADAEQADVQRVVNDFNELLTYLADEREVATAAAVALERALRPDGVAVHLLSSSQDRATLTLTRGVIAAEDLPRGTLDDCPGIRRGSAYLIDDLERPLSVPCPAHGAKVGAVACLPLSSGNARIGAIHLVWNAPTRVSPTAWGATDRICSQTALTIANRRLLASLEASANTDPRTRLPNSRSFDVQVERHLAARGSDAGAVVMLDLDHFKALNDRFGHPAGDEALRVFAELLRRSLRPGDMPARYGGEEFAIYLPGADTVAARLVAERIRALVEATPIVLGPGVATRITVSAGVAVAPEHGTERLELLAAADRALYAAKHGGRNQVVVARSMEPEDHREPESVDAQRTDGPASSTAA